MKNFDDELKRFDNFFNDESIMRNPDSISTKELDDRLVALQWGEVLKKPPRKVSLGEYLMTRAVDY